MFGVKRARCATLLAVIALAPIVRPWNAPKNAMQPLAASDWSSASL